MRYCLNKFPVLWFFCWGTILIPTLCHGFTEGGNDPLTERASNDIGHFPPEDLTSEVVTSLKELIQFANRIQRSTPGTISAEDLQKLKGIEHYFQRILSGEIREKPDPKVIEKHRNVLESIFNQLAANTKDSETNLSIKGLFSSLSNLTERGIQNSKDISIEKHNKFGDGGLVRNTNETSGSRQELRNGNNFNVPKNIQIAATGGQKRHINLNQGTISSLDKLNQETLLISTINKGNSSKNLSKDTIQAAKTEIWKRYGIYDDELNGLPGKNSLTQWPLRDQDLPTIAYPQASKIASQFNSLAHSNNHETAHQSGSANRQGTLLPSFHHSLGKLEAALESPLAITDVAALQGDVAKVLLELLLRSGNSATVSDYSNLLEKAMTVLAKSTKAPLNFNQNFPDNVMSSDSLSPELLASLLVRLLPPSVDNNTGSTDQALVSSGHVSLSSASGVLVGCVSDYFSALFDAIKAFFMAAPLVAALIAVALIACLYHLYKKKYGKKGYGHHDEGYHRRDWYDEYRKFDPDVEMQVVSNVLNKIAAFDDWLESFSEAGGDVRNSTKGLVT